MRERTTWDVEVIKKAYGAKRAEDPRAMNQDHLSQQPSADKYTIGDPSDFAEDVSPSNWKAEYEGGTTRRNEIGLPEFRKEAADQDQDDEDEDDSSEGDDIEKKANLCLDVARRILPKTASEKTIEDQALAFMYMPDRALIATATRLAQQQQESEEDQAQQGKQAQQQQESDEDQAQQSKQAQQQEEEEEGQGQQGKQAQQQQAADEDQGQDKQANLSLIACQAVAQGNMQLAQQTIQQMVQQAMQQQQAQQQAPAPVQAQDMGLLSQQIQQMVQQAMQQQQAPAVQAQQQQSDDLLIDQLLQQDQQGQSYTAGLDIEMDSNGGMDLGHTASEDDALKLLFAGHSEVREANQAHALQSGVPGVRTASTRTVGTRPTAGVAQLGGGSNVKTASDVDQLSSLWRSDPDVKGVFS